LKIASFSYSPVFGTQVGPCWNFCKVFDIRKLETLGYHAALIAWKIASVFLTHTSAWWTEGCTDRWNH